MAESVGRSQRRLRSSLGRGLIGSGLALAVFAGAGPAAAAGIDPLDSYLRTDTTDGFAGNAVAIDLAALGILPGDFVRLVQRGEYKGSPAGADELTGLVGVFSSSDQLDPGTNLNRVPGAIEAGQDVVTSVTSPGEFATDIPEDFLIEDLGLEVPAGATHLFVAAQDDFWGDNSDPDLDFRIQIQELPATIVPILPDRTYLQIDEPGNPLNPVPIVLANIGVSPGDAIRLQRGGFWADGMGAPDTETTMSAVFSAGSNLAVGSNPNRVLGAIDAGSDVVTPHDIPEDFAITDDVEIAVPEGATHLFVTAIDSVYADNEDPNNDFEVKVVPEPGAFGLGATALATTLLLSQRRRRLASDRRRRLQP